jgi:hypothetical protein
MLKKILKKLCIATTALTIANAAHGVADQSRRAILAQEETQLTPAQIDALKTEIEKIKTEQANLAQRIRAQAETEAQAQRAVFQRAFPAVKSAVTITPSGPVTTNPYAHL